MTSYNAAPDRGSPEVCVGENSGDSFISVSALPYQVSAVPSVRRTDHLFDEAESPKSLAKPVIRDDLYDSLDRNQISTVQSIKRTNNLTDSSQYASKQNIGSNSNGKITKKPKQSALESVRRTSYLSDSLDSPKSVSKLIYHM